MRMAFLYVALIAGVLSFTFNAQAEEKLGKLFAGAGLSYVGEDFDDGDLRWWRCLGIL